MSVNHSGRNEIQNSETSRVNGIVFSTAGVPRTTSTQCIAPQQIEILSGPVPPISRTTRAPPGPGPASLGMGCDRVIQEIYSPPLTRTNVSGAVTQGLGDNIDLRVTGYWTKRDVEFHIHPRGGTLAGSGITFVAQVAAAFPAALAIAPRTLLSVPDGGEF